MKLGLGGKMPAEGKGLVSKGEKGLEGGKTKAEGKGDGKGEVMGEDGALLSGLGYNTADHRSSAKNVAERSNLERFLKEMEPEKGKDADVKEQPESAKAKDKGETKETKEAAQEQAPTETKRETAEEAHVQGQAEAKEAAETQKSKEGKEAEGESQGQKQGDDTDDEDKPGMGWLAEELDGHQQERKTGAKSSDILGDSTRCRGSLEDGGRCLRHPVKGDLYCREHFVPPDSGPKLV